MRVYKILTSAEWATARATGRLDGSEDDRRDGFIHLSTAMQTPETVRRHFRGRGSLVLLAFDSRRLGEALRWEPSRGGALFPHFYGVLDLALVEEARVLEP
jgi:uncharacterized protein (DUF952 family)